MNIRLLALVLPTLLFGAALHAEDSLKEILRKRLEKEKRNADATAEAIAKNTDEKAARQMKNYEASLRDEIAQLEARFALADKSDDSFRQEISTLNRNLDQTRTRADAEQNPERKKPLEEQHSKLKEQIGKLYAELDQRVKDRLEQMFGKILTKEPFDRVIDEISRGTQAKILLDGSLGNVRLPLTLQEKDLTLERVLNGITDNANAGWRIDKGEIVILSAAELNKQSIKARMSRKVTFEFVDTPLDEAIAFLRSLSNVTMILDPKVLQAGMPTINLRVTDMDLMAAMDWILRLAGLKHTFAASAMYISKADDKFVDRDIRGEVLAEIEKGGPDAQWKADLITRLSRSVSFEFVDTPFEEAIGFMNSLTNVNVILDPKLAAEGKSKVPVTLRVQDMRMYEALFWICRQAEADYDLRNQAIFITAPKVQPDAEAAPVKPAANAKGAPAAAAGAGGAGAVLKLANGNTLELDIAALQNGGIREMLDKQLNDPAANGVLYFNLKDVKTETTHDEWKATIARVAPAVKVDFDDKFKLLIVQSDDAKALRKVAALMQALNLSPATK